MADIYVARCPRCEKSFRTRKLELHFSKKHPGNKLPENIRFHLVRSKLQRWDPRLLENRNMYLRWLAEVVKCINSAHKQSLRSRLVKKVDFSSVPQLWSAYGSPWALCEHFSPPPPLTLRARLSHLAHDFLPIRVQVNFLLCQVEVREKAESVWLLKLYIVTYCFSKMVPLHFYKCQTWILQSLVKENWKGYYKFSKGEQAPKTTIMEGKGLAHVI